MKVYTISGHKNIINPANSFSRASFSNSYSSKKHFKRLPNKNKHKLTFTLTQLRRKKTEASRHIKQYLIIKQQIDSKNDSPETIYSSMHDRYIELKITLTSLGVNLAELDKVKE